MWTIISKLSPLAFLFGVYCKLDWSVNMYRTVIALYTRIFYGLRQVWNTGTFKFAYYSSWLYSGTAMNGHLPTTATFLLQPVCNIENWLLQGSGCCWALLLCTWPLHSDHFPTTNNLLQLQLLCFPMGGSEETLYCMLKCFISCAGFSLIQGHLSAIGKSMCT